MDVFKIQPMFEKIIYIELMASMARQLIETTFYRNFIMATYFITVTGKFHHIISIFILITCRKAPEELYIEKLLSNYPDLLLKMPRCCSSVQVFKFLWKFMEEVLKYRTTCQYHRTRKSAVKCLF